MSCARNWRVAPRGKLLTRRVSIGDGAHRKKSHADGSSLFQWLSTAVRRSNFNPPNAAAREKKHGNDELVVARETGPRKGRAPQQIRLRTFVTISSGLRARGNVKRQGQRSTFRGTDAKQNCRAIGAGQESRPRRRSASGSCRNNSAGRAPRKVRPREAGVCKARLAVSGVSAAAQSSKPGSMSPLHAAPLTHRREGARKIVMALHDFANQRDKQAARRSYRRPARPLAVGVALINE